MGARGLSELASPQISFPSFHRGLATRGPCTAPQLPGLLTAVLPCPELQLILSDTCAQRPPWAAHPGPGPSVRQMQGGGVGGSGPPGPTDLPLLPFQLPYLIDGAHKVTQSNAILRYIARKHNLCEWDWGGDRAPCPWAAWAGMVRGSLLCDCRWGDGGGEDSHGHFGE